MSILIRNIDCLVTCEGSHRKKGKEMNDANIIENGFVFIEDDIISAVGKDEEYKSYIDEDTILLVVKAKQLHRDL